MLRRWRSSTWPATRLEMQARLTGELRENTKLKTLTLNHSNITDEGAAQLLEGLRANTTLTTLFLYDNPTSDALEQPMLDLVQQNKEDPATAQARAEAAAGAVAVPTAEAPLAGGAAAAGAAGGAAAAAAAVLGKAVVALRRSVAVWWRRRCLRVGDGWTCPSRLGSLPLFLLAHVCGTPRLLGSVSSCAGALLQLVRSRPEREWVKGV